VFRPTVEVYRRGEASSKSTSQALRSCNKLRPRSLAGAAGVHSIRSWGPNRGGPPCGGAV